jgi:hypothetical protein
MCEEAKLVIAGRPMCIFVAGQTEGQVLILLYLSFFPFFSGTLPVPQNKAAPLTLALIASRSSFLPLVLLLALLARTCQPHEFSKITVFFPLFQPVKQGLQIFGVFGYLNTPSNVLLTVLLCNHHTVLRNILWPPFVWI